MDEDQILQSIIADPDVVDPTIDVSQLRKTTPTSPRLLGNVSGIEGLRFDPTRTDYIRDLYSVYGGGLPTIDVAPVVDTTTPVVDTTTPVVDTSGTDQVTGSGGTTPTSTDFEQGLIDQGIGVQDAIGDPVVALGEIPVTQEEIDTFNASALTGGVPDTNITAPSGDVFAAGDPLVEEKIDFAPEQQGLIDQAFSKVGSTASDIMNDLSQIPGAIADFANQTVDIAGQKINVGRTLAAAAVNQIIGAPVSLVFDLLPEQSIAQTTTLNIVDKLKNEKGKSYSRFSQPVGNINVDPFGRSPTNPESYEETLKDDILGRNQSGFETAERRAAKTDYARDYFNDKAKAATGVELNKDTVLGPAEIGPVTTLEQQLGQIAKDANVEIGLPPSTVETFRGPTMAEVAGTGKGTIGTTTEIDDFDFGPEIGKAAPTTSKDPIGSFFDAVDEAAGGGTPSGGLTDAQAEANRDAAMGGGNTGSTGVSDAQAAANQDAARGGGSGSSGGGKIVCTMMNESYGFGSFRNKIWLRHSKDLAPEYQKGYHKIFLPLVKLSKNNKVLKIMLEHIAVHRTIDIRQESRGKVHLPGRVYRKILEPICYWVGKYVK